MITPQIRAARREDAASLQKNCKAGGTLQQVEQQLEWTCRERGLHVLEHLVAVHEGEVIGNAMLTPKTAHALVRPDGSVTLCRGRAPAEPDVVRLDDWVVAASAHGTGVATALAMAVIEEARAWGALMIESSSANPRAIAALAKVGFREWGRFPHPSGQEEVFVVLKL